MSSNSARKIPSSDPISDMEPEIGAADQAAGVPEEKNQALAEELIEKLRAIKLVEYPAKDFLRCPNKEILSDLLSLIDDDAVVFDMTVEDYSTCRSMLAHVDLSRLDDRTWWVLSSSISSVCFRERGKCGISSLKTNGVNLFSEYLNRSKGKIKALRARGDSMR